MNYGNSDDVDEGGNDISTLDAEFGSRLKEVVRLIGDAKSAEVTGRSSRSIARYVSGKEPPISVVTQLARAAGVSITWLATGEGPRDSATQTSHVPLRTEQEQVAAVKHLDPRLLDADRMVLVPVLDVEVSAGTGIISESERVSAFVAFSEAYLREIGVNPRTADILQVTGRSMIPTLADRDWVLVDRSIDHVIDEALYAVVYGGMVLVKRVRLARDGAVTLSSDNKAEGYGDEHVRPSELHTLNIVGRVKAHCRPL